MKTRRAYRLSANAILFQAGAIVHAQFPGPFGNSASSRVLLAIGAPELRRNLPPRAVGTPPTGPCGSLNGPNIRPATPRRWITLSTQPAKLGLQFLDALPPDLVHPFGRKRDEPREL